MWSYPVQHDIKKHRTATTARTEGSENPASSASRVSPLSLFVEGLDEVDQGKHEEGDGAAHGDCCARHVLVDEY